MSADDPAPKIGTLGLHFFLRRVLLLDLPGQRFAVLDSTAPLPPEIERRASWVPIEYRNDKMFLPLTLNGKVYDDFFYDSGASLFAVSTTPEVWRDATGRTGSEPDNVTWTVPSFGDPVVLRGAPARGRLSIGAASLGRPLIFHLASGPERLDPRNWGFRTSGLIGNALFEERYMLIVDLPRRRFGLVERR